MRLVLTEHAKERMTLYAITKEQIKRAILRGGKVPQTDGLQANFGYLQVAYKVRGDVYIIKTIKIAR